MPAPTPLTKSGTATPGANGVDESWRIVNKIAKARAEGRIWWSFEYFPPRTAQGFTNLYDRIERMAGLGPEFCDITIRTSTYDFTTQLLNTVQRYIGVETCMHLVAMPKEDVDKVLKGAKDAGCRNILVLRGDPPETKAEWDTKSRTTFMYAIDLVRYIKEQYGDYFALSVAGFPEGHIEAVDGKEAEMERLKAKVDAGADFIFTQMFYDFDIFANWVREVRAAGITVPIVPGIMPIQTYGGYKRATERFRTIVPQSFHDALDPIKEDDAQVREVGTKLVGDMCRKIIDPANGLDICGLHIYTMNLERGSRMLLEYLGLQPSAQQLKPLPWTPSLTPRRRDEGIRPIFWANRAKSYVDRTETWDEFPNGRWGDARSPAYGDVDAYGITLNYKPEEAEKLWGKPESVAEVHDIFVRFCKGEIKTLPWSENKEGGFAKETGEIGAMLTRVNEKGYLTINSQPAVDGARSDDPVHGWGPKHGYVYQKAYLEFFVCPTKLDELIKKIERDPQITYHAVNAQGDMRTNTTSEAPNAVTWGCFPHKEIVQPTIVESVSFLAWKDEAYTIGDKFARLYPPGSKSREVLQDVFGSYFLVNVVHNDFKRGSAAIFEIFGITPADVGVAAVASAAPQPAKAAAQSVNNVVASAVNGIKAAVSA